MKYFHVILLIILFTQQVYGQGSSSWTKLDTLKVYNNKVLVDFTTYSDSTIIKQGQALLYPDSLRKKALISKRAIPADSMVLHGTVKSQLKNGKYSIGQYDNGRQIEMIYYDSDGNVITYQEFYRGQRKQWNPEQGTNLFLIQGTNKKKE